MSKFCPRCKQKIPEGFFLQTKPVEFEDGLYCEQCAKIKVRENRGE